MYVITVKIDPIFPLVKKTFPHFHSTKIHWTLERSKRFETKLLLYDLMYVVVDKHVFFKGWTIEDILGLYVHMDNVKAMKYLEAAN
jgi:hypothetical protein